MSAENYSLCGVQVILECHSSDQGQKIYDLWRKCFVLEGSSEGRLPQSISIQIVHDWSCSNEPTIEQDLFHSGDLRVSKTTEGFYVQRGRSFLHLRANRFQGIGVLSGDFWNRPFREQREFFLITFVLLLRAYGLYGLHSNAVVKNESGVLIVGNSGSGKTTLTLSLIREGWSYVSDDAIMLREDANGVKALALRSGFSCTEATMSSFPELAQARVLSTSVKTVLDGDTVFADMRAAQCRPKLIVFPSIADAPISKLVPIDPTTALVKLMEQSVGIAAGGPSTLDHMRTLNGLVHQASAFRLETGSDVYDDPGELSNALSRTLSGTPA